MMGAPRYAVLFPGQGSQAPGMGLAVARRFGESAAVLEAAERAVPGLMRLLAEGPEAELVRTSNTQPALLAASLALWAAWRLYAPAPACAAGHSLGEYSALAAAGALPAEQAVWLVRERGRCMEQAMPAGQGGMGAVMGLEEGEVTRLCQEVADQLGGSAAAVVAANFNAPGQVVVSGLVAALREVEARVRQAGGRYVPLAVSGPFHSPWMEEAARQFAAALERIPFLPPAFPVYSNVTARPHEPSADSIRRHLRAQLTSPVRWADAVRAMGEAGVTHFVELGPGKVLSGLVRRILPPAVTLNVSDPDSLEAALARLRKDGIA